MPNWCSNTVIVEGRKREIKRFVKYVETASKTSPFSFQAILPMPRELEGTRSPATIVTQEEYETWKAQAEFNPHYLDNPVITQEMSDGLVVKYGTNNWYDWKITNWGTKGDILGEGDMVIDEPTYLRYVFDTAWSPPNGIYKELVRQFPKLTIDWPYQEENMELFGNLATDVPPATRYVGGMEEGITTILRRLKKEGGNDATI